MQKPLISENVKFPRNITCDIGCLMIREHRMITQHRRQILIGQQRNHHLMIPANYMLDHRLPLSRSPGGPLLKYRSGSVDVVED